ncbi:MAG: ribose 5-phosphate isomerase B [Myxococcales bacterium]|nr:ribose 5-phosphate isomerase B [Myxococcales bacterium]
MKFHVGSDHAGYGLKEHLLAYLQSHGHEVVNHGAASRERVDYPNFAGAVSKALQTDLETGDTHSRGLLVCGSGIGVSITANRFRGIRAVVAAVEAQAALGRAHNNANVLCLGERLTGLSLAERILDAFIATSFEEGRHTGRVGLIDSVSLS